MPNEITYSIVINACAKGGESQRALNLLDEMRSRGLVPDIISYNSDHVRHGRQVAMRARSVINACAKGGESQRALNLLDEMRSRGLVPDMISRTTASLTRAPRAASVNARSICSIKCGFAI